MMASFVVGPSALRSERWMVVAGREQKTLRAGSKSQKGDRGENKG